MFSGASTGNAVVKARDSCAGGLRSESHLCSVVFLAKWKMIWNLNIVVTVLYENLVFSANILKPKIRPKPLVCKIYYYRWILD